jgi:hypothetical protein
MLIGSPRIDSPPFPAPAANVRVGIVAGEAVAYFASLVQSLQQWPTSMECLLFWAAFLDFKLPNFSTHLCCLKQHHIREKKWQNSNL